MWHWSVSLKKNKTSYHVINIDELRYIMQDGDKTV
ncbi:hypothetical protein M2132_001744 [Dysgonomonas sp. PH5-45]|nr:hypothetical protein [Dysgonomonas sp. PH5-45]MDH6388299.1 hypothetical protein [Dysgonomonas sp. PH5-37]